MALTTDEVLTVNGVALNTYAKNIDSLTGRLRTPAKRTSNISIPGKHGSLRVPDKRFDENVIVLPMWVVGADDNGRVPVGSSAREEFYKRVDELSSLFLSSADMLDIRHTLPDGSVRQCFGDVLDVLDFTTLPNAIAQFSVSITVPDAFWQDVDPISEERVASGSSVTFDAFQAATAPMEDLDATLTGPWTNPRLTFSDGSWVQYNGAIAAGQSLTIHSGDWTLTGVGFTPALPSLTYSGSSSHWISMPPGNGVVTLTGTARTTATALTLEGRRKYLVG